METTHNLNSSVALSASPAAVPFSVDGAQRLWKSRHGIAASVQANNRVARSMQQYGEWAEQELDLLSGFVEDGQTVLEVGGDYGAHSLWLSRAVGEKGSVHVAEPRRIEFQQLCANVALNGLGNVYAHSVWLGRDGDQVVLASVLPGSGGEHVRGSTVDQLSLDALHLLKVNLPGTLVSLLQGAVDTLRRFHPIVYFRLGTGEHAVAEVKALKDLGYRCWSHVPYLFNGDNYAGSSDNLFPGCVHQNVIAAPIEMHMELDRLREI